MTLAGLFWESLNYKMSVWDISLFFGWEAAGFWSIAQLLPFFWLKILGTEHFVLHGQMSLIQKERTWGEPRA